MLTEARATILIVDDDRMNRMALAELLQAEARILMAKDGASALDVLARETVSLVLLDVSMPGMDGYEVLRRIRSDPALKDLGVIFITGMSDEEDEERGLLMGATDYVRKPFRPTVVRARVKIHLKLWEQHRDLEQLALRDALTGIANRRFFDLAFERALKQAARGRQPMALAMFDVDHFKAFNDTYGHSAGDGVLKQVAETLSQLCRRPGDVGARYGGEEFVLLVSDVSSLQVVSERFRRDIQARAIPHRGSSTADVVTISGGGLIFSPDPGSSMRVLLKQADQRLYKAKQDGRNRVFIDPAP